jgi:hypothetical protein
MQIKHSGDDKEYATGATREVKVGKGRPDLIPLIALWRWAIHCEEGGKIHGDRNWEKGLPLSTYACAAFRVLWNVGCWMHTKQRIDDGLLPQELDDLPAEKNLESFLTSGEKCGMLKSMPQNRKIVPMDEPPGVEFNLFPWRLRQFYKEWDRQRRKYNGGDTEVTQGIPSPGKV